MQWFWAKASEDEYTTQYTVHRIPCSQCLRPRQKVGSLGGIKLKSLFVNVNALIFILKLLSLHAHNWDLFLIVLELAHLTPRKTKDDKTSCKNSKAMYIFSTIPPPPRRGDGESPKFMPRVPEGEIFFRNLISFSVTKHASFLNS